MEDHTAEITFSLVIFVLLGLARKRKDAFLLNLLLRRGNMADHGRSFPALRSSLGIMQTQFTSSFCGGH
jgi:hypothetical protein